MNFLISHLKTLEKNHVQFISKLMRNDNDNDNDSDNDNDNDSLFDDMNSLSNFKSKSSFNNPINFTQEYQQIKKMEKITAYIEKIATACATALANLNTRQAEDIKSLKEVLKQLYDFLMWPQ